MTSMKFDTFPDYDWHDEHDGPYYACNVYAEHLEFYRMGGYRPVHLGETLQQGRYKIVHKLGWGRNGVVWLARDMRYVGP